MFYLELQHGPSCVGVKQQTVGSDAGARIARILHGGLCKNNNSGHGFFSVPVAANKLWECVLFRITALCLAACSKLCAMNLGVMRRHGRSLTSEFIRATRAASRRASAGLSHTWWRRRKSHTRAEMLFHDASPSFMVELWLYTSLQLVNGS